MVRHLVCWFGGGAAEASGDWWIVSKRFLTGEIEHRLHISTPS